jgi:hypothetical protein
MNQQNNTWQDKLRKDFEAKFYMLGSLYSPMGGSAFEHLWSWWNERIQSELQRALQECLPEELQEIYNEDDFIEGHRHCRKQFIKNAKSLGIEIK